MKSSTFLCVCILTTVVCHAGGGRGVDDDDVAVTKIVATYDEIETRTGTPPSAVDIVYPSYNWSGLSPNLTRHYLMEEARRYRLESIKVDILRKLKLDSPPNVTARIPRIPSLIRLMEGLESMQNDQSTHRSASYKRRKFNTDDVAMTTNVLKLPEKPPWKVPTDTNQSLVYYTVESEVMKYTIKAASLWVYIKKPDVTSAGANVTSADVMLNIYEVTENKRNSGDFGRNKLLTETIGVEKLENWFAFNMKSTVLKWGRIPGLNRGLHVEALDCQGRNLVFIHGSEPHHPVLQLDVTDRGRYRTRRASSGLECDESDEEDRCCRYPMTVDFVKIDWSFIHMPKTYQANYCFGDCSYDFLPESHHSHVYNLAKPRGRLGPCCTAHDLSAISVLYNDDNGHIILGLLPGMVVDRCGC